CKLAAPMQELATPRLEAPVHLIQKGERRGTQNLLPAAGIDALDGGRGVHFGSRWQRARSSARAAPHVPILFSGDRPGTRASSRVARQPGSFDLRASPARGSIAPLAATPDDLRL